MDGKFCEKLAIHRNPAGSPREKIGRENQWKLEICFFFLQMREVRNSDNLFLTETR